MVGLDMTLYVRPDMTLYVRAVLPSRCFYALSTLLLATHLVSSQPPVPSTTVCLSQAWSGGAAPFSLMSINVFLSTAGADPTRTLTIR